MYLNFFYWLYFRVVRWFIVCDWICYFFFVLILLIFCIFFFCQIRWKILLKTNKKIYIGCNNIKKLFNSNIISNMRISLSKNKTSYRVCSPITTSRCKHKDHPCKQRHELLYVEDIPFSVSIHCNLSVEHWDTSLGIGFNHHICELKLDTRTQSLSNGKDLHHQSRRAAKITISPSTK